MIFLVLAFLRGVCASALASSTHSFLSQRDKKQGAPARAGDLPAQPATFVVDPKSRSSKMFLFHRTPRLDCARNTSLTPSPRRTRRPPSPSWRPSCGSPRQRWPGHYTRGQHPPVGGEARPLEKEGRRRQAHCRGRVPTSRRCQVANPVAGPAGGHGSGPPRAGRLLSRRAVRDLAHGRRGSRPPRLL